MRSILTVGLPGLDSLGILDGITATVSAACNELPRTIRCVLDPTLVDIEILVVAPKSTSHRQSGSRHTEEFSLRRLGDQAKADAVYAGVDEPIVQAAPHKVHRSR